MIHHEIYTGKYWDQMISIFRILWFSALKLPQDIVHAPDLHPITGVLCNYPVDPAARVITMFMVVHVYHVFHNRPLFVLIWQGS